MLVERSRNVAGADALAALVDAVAAVPLPLSEELRTPPSPQRSTQQRRFQKRTTSRNCLLNTDVQ